MFNKIASYVVRIVGISVIILSFSSIPFSQAVVVDNQAPQSGGLSNQGPVVKPIPPLPPANNKGKTNVLKGKEGNVGAGGFHQGGRTPESFNKDSYVPDEIIVKFKDEPVSVVAGDIVERGQDFATVTDDNTLDELNKRFKVKKMKRVFHGYEGTKSKSFQRITKMEAKRRHAEIQADEKVKVKSLRTKHAKKGRQIPVDAEKNVPKVAGVYTVKLEKGADLQAAVRAYKENPHIEYAQPNYIMNVQMVPNDPYWSSTNTWGQGYDDLWGLKKIQADKAWDIADGTGVVVAVVDTGVDYNHPDISGNIWSNSDEIPGNGIDDDHNGYIDDVRGWDFAYGDAEVIDRMGHGTHVAGTIAAVGNNNTGIIGVAPKAKIMPVKGLSDTGSGYTDRLAAGIKYAAENGADVINNSWGGGPSFINPVAEDAVRYAYNLGSVVVFAAGNSTQDVYAYSPQNQPQVITVAASSEIDRNTNFSNFGEMLDVAAPGGAHCYDPEICDRRNILSLKSATVADRMLVGSSPIVGGQYLRLAGTSMAAPHVAGLAALIVQKHPEFTVEEVRQAIRVGSDDTGIGTPGYNSYVGHGRINALKSLNVSSPLSVVITEPASAWPISAEAITIKGTVSGPALTSWTLDYANHNNNNWTRIASSSAPVTNNTLAVWNLSDVQEMITCLPVPGTTTVECFPHYGTSYVLKLRAVDSAGKVYEDRQVVTIDKVVITEPDSWDIKVSREAEVISIRGTVIPNGFSDYTIDILNSKGEVVPGTKIVLTNGGLQTITNGLLATWDTTGMPAGFYTIRLNVHLQGGLPYPEEMTSVVIDPSIHAGWPKQLEYLGYPLYSQLTTADINADKKDDIIFAYGSTVSVLDHTGVVLPGWPQPIDTLQSDDAVQRGPVVGDMDGDGQPEIAAFTEGGKTYLWNADGSLVPGWPRSLSAQYGVIDDVNNDGRKELVVTGGNTIDVKKSDGTSLPGWPFTFSPGFDITSSTQVSIGDVDNDGFKEIAVAADMHTPEKSGYPVPRKVYLFENNGTIMPGWPKSISFGTWDNYLYETYPILGQLDSDGDLEIVLGTMEGNLEAFHHDGTNVAGWPQTIQIPSYWDQILLTGYTVNLAAIGDIDGDGDNEVVASIMEDYINLVDHYIYAWHGNGNIVDGWPVKEPMKGSGWYGFGSLVLADVDDDGKADIIAAKDSVNYLFAYNYLGKAVNGFPKPTVLASHPSGTTTPAVSDMDGDGLYEIAWVDWFNRLYMWDTTSKATNPRPWPMYGHDAQHTGSAYDSTPPSTPVVTAPASITSSGALNLSWTAAVDTESGVTEYQYRITQDSTSGAVVKNWTSVGTATSVAVTGISFAPGKTYYVGVKAKNGSGGWSAVGYSSGIPVRNLPTIVSITPNAGNVAPGQAATFTTVFSDPDGWANIQYVYFLMNTSITGTNSLYVYYNQNTNRLYLRDDANATWLGGFAPGSANFIENSYAKLDCSKVTVTGSGTTMTVVWPVTLKSAFTGSKKSYLQVVDDTNLTQSWTQKGTWTITNTPPQVGTVTPAAGASIPGQAVNIATSYSDADSWQNIQSVMFLVNSSISPTNSFYGYYVPATNKLYLRDDTSSSWLGGFAPGSANVMENSYVKLDCAKTTVSKSGNNLTVNWNVTFKASFLGTKNMYLYVLDVAGAANGFTSKGTWRIANPPSKPIVTTANSCSVDKTTLAADFYSTDTQTGISEYQYKITKGAMDGYPAAVVVKDWTSVGIATSATATGLNLAPGWAYYFNVKAKNGAGLWSSVGVGYTIVDSAPVITSPTMSAMTVRVGQLLQFVVSATDADGDVLMYSAFGGLPPGASINGFTGQFNWTPGAGNVGTAVVKLEVWDGHCGTAYKDITITVTP